MIERTWEESRGETKTFTMWLGEEFLIGQDFEEVDDGFE
jgi:hypothetical protein